MLDLCLKVYPDKAPEILLKRDEQERNTLHYFGKSIDFICRFKLSNPCLIFAKDTFTKLTNECRKSLKKHEINFEKKEEEEDEGENDDLESIRKSDLTAFIWAMIRRTKNFNSSKETKLTDICNIFNEIHKIESIRQTNVIDINNPTVKNKNILENLSIAAAKNSPNYNKISNIINKYEFLKKLETSFLKNTRGHALNNLKTEATARSCTLDRLEELAKIILNIEKKRKNYIEYDGKTASKKLAEKYGESTANFQRIADILKISKSLKKIYESYLTSYIEYTEEKIMECTKLMSEQKIILRHKNLLKTLLKNLKFVAEHCSDEDRAKICDLLLKKRSHEGKENYRTYDYDRGAFVTNQRTVTYKSIFSIQFNYAETNPAYIDILAALIKRGKIEKVKAILGKDNLFAQKYKSNLDKISLELINNKHSIFAISLMVDCKWPKTNLKKAIMMAINHYITNPPPTEKIRKSVIKAFSTKHGIVNKTLEKGGYSLKQLQLFRKRLTASRAEHSSRIPGVRNPVTGLEKIVDSFIRIKIQEENKKQKELKEKAEEEVEENNEKKNKKSQESSSSGKSFFSNIFSSSSSSGKKEKQKIKKQDKEEEEIELADREDKNDGDGDNNTIM